MSHLVQYLEKNCEQNLPKNDAFRALFLLKMGKKAQFFSTKFTNGETKF